MTHLKKFGYSDGFLIDFSHSLFSNFLYKR